MKWLPKFRFSVRTLMILTALFGLALTPLVINLRRAQLQKEAVAWVLANGGTVSYGVEKSGRANSYYFSSYQTFTIYGDIFDGEEDEPIELQPIDDLFLIENGLLPDDPFGEEIIETEAVTDEEIDEVAIEVEEWVELDASQFPTVTTSFGCIGGTVPRQTGWFEKLVGPDFLYPVVEVFMEDSKVSDISRLSQFKKLEILELVDMKVKDLSPLADLKKLKYLDLTDSEVSDLSPLKNLPNIAAILLTDTNVTDISPLKNCTKLECVVLTGCQVSDIQALAEATDLAELELEETFVSDISPLKKLTNLVELNLAETPVKDLSPLAGMAKLASLDLSRTNLVILDPICTLHGLEELMLQGKVHLEKDLEMLEESLPACRIDSKPTLPNILPRKVQLKYGNYTTASIVDTFDGQYWKKRFP